ncbi:MAG TPA: hypothetical protein VIZ43_22145 [Trebonia sp.]
MAHAITSPQPDPPPAADGAARGGAAPADLSAYPLVAELVSDAYSVLGPLVEETTSHQAGSRKSVQVNRVRPAPAGARRSRTSPAWPGYRAERCPG